MHIYIYIYIYIYNYHHLVLKHMQSKTTNFTRKK